MNRRLATVLGILFGNYVATILILSITMPVLSRPKILISIAMAHLSPFAEWNGATVLVPAFFLVGYFTLKSKSSLLLRIAIPTLVSWLFVLSVDALHVLPMEHVTYAAFLEQMVFRLARIAIAVGLGTVVADKLDQHLGSLEPTTSRRRSLTGFTTVELLVVVAIILVVAAILFTTAGGAKKRSNEAVDISNMRQVYMALSMYAEDKGQHPASLLYLSDYIPSKSLFSSPEDKRAGEAGSYPADLYVFDSKRRSPFKISYAYLRAFENSEVWHPRLSWQAFLEDPSVGILANGWYRPRSSFNLDLGNEAEHGHLCNPGPMLRIRMDGSLWRAYPRDGTVVGGSINGLFVDP